MSFWDGSFYDSNTKQNKHTLDLVSFLNQFSSYFCDKPTGNVILDHTGDIFEDIIKLSDKQCLDNWPHIITRKKIVEKLTSTIYMKVKNNFLVYKKFKLDSKNKVNSVCEC